MVQYLTQAIAAGKRCPRRPMIAEAPASVTHKTISFEAAMQSRKLLVHIGSIFLLGAVAGCAPSGRATTMRAPTVSTSDVHRFIEAARGMAPADTTCAPLAGYFRDGSPGLTAYARKFSVGRAEFCAAL